MLGAPNVELAPNTFLLALAGFGAEPSPPKKPPPPPLLPLPPKIELVAASVDVVVAVWGVEAAPKADLLPPKTDEPPEVPPPNIEAEPEVDPALPNTDDEDVVVVVVVAVPPKTEGEEIVEPIVKYLIIDFGKY